MAEIVDVVGSNYIINYFHNTSSNKFIDGKEDHDEVKDNEIVKKLPLSTLNGASERQISQISFSIDFFSYILDTHNKIPISTNIMFSLFLKNILVGRYKLLFYFYYFIYFIN